VVLRASFREHSPTNSRTLEFAVFSIDGAFLSTCFFPGPSVLIDAPFSFFLPPTVWFLV